MHSKTRTVIYKTYRDVVFVECRSLFAGVELADHDVSFGAFGEPHGRAAGPEVNSEK